MIFWEKTAFMVKTDLDMGKPESRYLVYQLTEQPQQSTFPQPQIFVHMEEKVNFHISF
jgi:hypothetical protein